MLPQRNFCAKLTTKMISLVASPRNEMIEQSQMFNVRRKGELNAVTKCVFDAAFRCLDYAYDPFWPDYDNSRLVRLPKQRKISLISLANQRFQVVPQRTFTTTSDAANRIFCQPVFDYDSVGGVFIWPNQDPIGELGGLNLYAYVGNNPVNAIDPLGLDIWVVQSPSWPGHQWVVGQNPNGSYWDANFHPDTKSGWALNSKGKTDFNPNSGFDPNHLDNGVVMKDHVKTCPAVDAKVRNEAEQRANDPNQPRYDVLGNSCRDFSCGMANYARGAQLRANIGN